MLRQDESLGAGADPWLLPRLRVIAGGRVIAVAEESPYSGPNGGPSRSARRQPARRQVAVAIQNRPGDPRGHGRGAPRVVASGRGALADQILQIAFDRGVKVRSDADLAEILATIEVESEIPIEALAAVAEILSYVYRTQSTVTSSTVTSARVAPESGA